MPRLRDDFFKSSVSISSTSINSNRKPPSRSASPQDEQNTILSPRELSRSLDDPPKPSRSVSFKEPSISEASSVFAHSTSLRSINLGSSQSNAGDTRAQSPREEPLDLSGSETEYLNRSTSSTRSLSSRRSHHSSPVQKTVPDQFERSREDAHSNNSLLRSSNDRSSGWYSTP